MEFLENSIEMLKNEIAQMKEQIDDQHCTIQNLIQQLNEPRAVLFSVLSRDQNNYKIKLNKDETIGLPLIKMTPHENPLCILEYSPSGSKITFKKSGTYQLNFNVSILGAQKSAISTPIQIYTKVNGGECDMQFCSIPPTEIDWLSYSTGSNICKYKENDNIVFYIRAYADVELWGSSNCYTTFSLIYLNP